MLNSAHAVEAMRQGPFRTVDSPVVMRGGKIRSELDGLIVVGNCSVQIPFLSLDICQNKLQQINFDRTES